MVVRHVLAIWTLALGAVQGPEQRVVIVEPTDESYVVGPTRLRAVVEPAVPAPLTVVFQVDGIDVCRVTSAPFECAFEAGPRVESRVVRVVATFGGGRRATAAVRTRQMAVSETQVDAVTVSTHVSDESGRFVKGLTAADFSILEDGVPQTVQLLGTGEIPAEVLLALDVSRSMEPEIEDLKLTVRQFIDALPDTANVAVAAFNSNLFLMSPFESDRAARTAGLGRLRAWGLTAIYDTMIRAVDILRGRGTRRALVFFTDGEDVASRSSIETARIALQSHDILLYIVTTGRAAGDGELRAQLGSLARETGGAFYHAARLSHTAEHFQDIAVDMANQYVLSFPPRRPLGDGKYRVLNVTVNNPRYRVRARTGYFAIRNREGR